MDKDELVELWEKRKIEIKNTGNCMNGNPHSPQKYFRDEGKRGYTPEEMIAYCDRMIERILKVYDRY